MALGFISSVIIQKKFQEVPLLVSPWYALISCACSQIKIKIEKLRCLLLRRKKIFFCKDFINICLLKYKFEVFTLDLKQPTIHYFVPGLSRPGASQPRCVAGFQTASWVRYASGLQHVRVPGQSRPARMRVVITGPFIIFLLHNHSVNIK